MPSTRLVPAVVVVVLLLTSPIAAVTAAAAPPDSDGAGGAGGASGSGSASGSVSSGGPEADANATVIPGSGAVTAVAAAPDGGQYVAGVTGLAAPNRTLTRLAPNGTVQWQRTTPAAGESRVPTAMATDPSGGVYLVERVGTPRTVDGPPTQRRPQAELSRVGPDGTVVWTQSLGNATRSSRAGGLVATTDGVVLARPGTDRETTRLRHYAPTGAVEWTRRYAGGTPRALASSSDGGYLVAGQRGFGTGWLLAVNGSGAVTVNETYGTRYDRTVTGVVPAADGGALLAGSAETRFAGSAPWVARVDEEGVARWSRTYGDATDSRAYPEAAVPTDGGVLVVNQLRDRSRQRTSLTHVRPDGAVGERTITGPSRATTPLVSGETVRLYGVRLDRQNMTVTGTVRTVGLPNATADDRAVHATVASNETFYRGQNLRLPGSTTKALYELPTEFSDFEEPRLVRRVGPDAGGTVAVESATLSSGRYAVRAAPGYWLAIEDDRYRLTTNASRAAFELDDHDVNVFRGGLNRTVVETFEGESRVRVRVRANPAELPLRVGLSRLNGSSVAAEDLRAVMAPHPGAAAGVTTADGRAYAPVKLPDDGNLTLKAGALPAGLYELSVTGLETADAADTATTRLVVVREERPVELVPANRSLVATPNASATTALTLAGVDGGLGALRIEANSSAPPATRLNLEFTDAVDYASASGSAGRSRDGATAATESTDIRSAPRGNVTVATLTVGTADFGGRAETDTTGTSTVHVRVAFLVDSEGVPYSVGEDSTVTVELREGGADEAAT